MFLALSVHGGIPMAWQKTIRRAVSVQGVGIHGGEQVSVQLRPAPPGTGVVFVRTKISVATPVIT